jgi:methyl-accepting chemotaxis protein
MLPRLMLAFGALALLTVIVGVVGLRAVSSLNDDGRSLKVNGFDAAADLAAAETHVTASWAHALRIAAEGDNTAGFARMTEQDASADAELDRYLTDYSLPANVLADARTAKAATVTFRAERAKVLDAVKAKDRAALTAALAATQGAFESVDAAFAKAIASNDADTARLAGALEDTAGAGRRNMIILMALAIGLAVGLGLLIARSVSDPVNDLKGLLGKVADGDLTVKATERATDELGELSKSLNTTVDSTRAAIAHISNAVTVLQATAAHLASNATQVTASIETVASGTEEMTASVREISTSASQASSIATSAVSLSDNAVELIAKLDESSRQISSVVDMISAIAEQTNLLALNATIEAARAGEAGRGFAIVANSVKELAQETTKATEAIRATVGNIQNDSQSARGAMARISEVIGTIHDSQSTIASAVEEQTITASEISRQLVDATTGTGAISHGREGSAEELSRLARELSTIVGSFKI